MKKKILVSINCQNKMSYSVPTIKIFDMDSEGSLLDTFTGGGTQAGDPIVNGSDPDNSDDNNRSKRFSIWDNEFDEW